MQVGQVLRRGLEGCGRNVTTGGRKVREPTLGTSVGTGKERNRVRDLHEVLTWVNRVGSFKWVFGRYGITGVRGVVLELRPTVVGRGLARVTGELTRGEVKMDIGGRQNRVYR